MKHEFAPIPAGYKMSKERALIDDSSLPLRTFNEWSKMGYQILKGSKSVGRNRDGVPLFTYRQVKAASRSCFGPVYYEAGDDDFDGDLPGNPMDYGCKD
jgi:hypothetical protein